MTNDVEKRWHDSHGFRSAARYTVAVIVSALAILVACIMWAVWGTNAGACDDAAFVVCADPERTVLVTVPPALLLAGGIGAFVQTYRVWRRGGAWPIWQGAWWVILVFMVIYMGMAVSVER